MQTDIVRNGTKCEGVKTNERVSLMKSKIRILKIRIVQETEDSEGAQTNRVREDTKCVGVMEYRRGESVNGEKDKKREVERAEIRVGRRG